MVQPGKSHAATKTNHRNDPQLTRVKEPAAEKRIMNRVDSTREHDVGKAAALRKQCGCGVPRRRSRRDGARAAQRAAQTDLRDPPPRHFHSGIDWSTMVLTDHGKSGFPVLTGERTSGRGRGKAERT